MSDYIFSSNQQPSGVLTKSILSIYKVDPPLVNEFHGVWGSLAVSHSHYHGFKPYETEQHIFVIIGGPVLFFQDNNFLVQEDSDIASKVIYERWVIDGEMQWDKDLSGPFTALLVNKKDASLQIVTDLMSFIPVYKYQESGGLFLATHVDALAKSANKENSFDQVSLVDFILNNVITYPFTAYLNIFQLAPSSTTTLSVGEEHVEPYWQPIEKHIYSNVKVAAAVLRNGVEEYIARITESMHTVGQFISGGEDSRALSGLLPSYLKRDAFVFLDQMNREGRLAKKVAQIYGAEFQVGYRQKTHYLDIMEEASQLVGSGHQYIHAHSLRFDKKYILSQYSAVFGGYLSDSLLKAAYSRKVRGLGRFPFIPELYCKGETRTKSIRSDFFKVEILDEITDRRKSLYSKLVKIRPNTAHEFFVLWPATMRTTMPNFYTTRRLFRSYEPFMCNEVVKLSAAVPTKWKLNHRLFNKAMQFYLKPSKWLLHADGRLPYFSFWVNIPIQTIVWLYRYIARKIGLIKGHQGPWSDWNSVASSQEYLNKFKPYYSICRQLEFDPKDIVKLKRVQQVNLLQVVQRLSKNS